MLFFKELENKAVFGFSETFWGYITHNNPPLNIQMCFYLLLTTNSKINKSIDFNG